MGRKLSDGSALVDIAEQIEAGEPAVGSVGASSDGVQERPAKTATFMRRRGSGGQDGRPDDKPVPFKASLDEMKQQLRHLAPSNRAANPRSTRTNVFKIKQGLSVTTFVPGHGQNPLDERIHRGSDVIDSSESTPLLKAVGQNGAQTENGYGSGSQKKDGGRLQPPG